MRITFIREHLIIHTKLATTSLSSIRYHKKYHQRSFGLDLQFFLEIFHNSSMTDIGLHVVSSEKTIVEDYRYYLNEYDSLDEYGRLQKLEEYFQKYSFDLSHTFLLYLVLVSDCCSYGIPHTPNLLN